MSALATRHVDFSRERRLGLVVIAAACIGVAILIARTTLESPPPPLEYRVTDSQDIPAAIAIAPDGAVWFTLESSDKIGVLRDGHIVKMARGGETLEALGLAVDEGGAWLTNISGQSIEHIALDGSLDSVTVPGPLAQLGRLALAPDGSVWYADSWSNSVTRVHDRRLEPHAAAESNAAPFGVAVANDGTVWATLQIANKLMRIDPQGVATELDVLTGNATPTDIALDASGGVWFTELRSNKIGHFADGHFSELQLPNDALGLTSIATAPDGSVWFTELRRQRLARLRNGSVTEFALQRPDARPFTLVVSGSGDVWYADLGGWIGKLPAARAQSDQWDLAGIVARLRHFTFEGAAAR